MTSSFRDNDDVKKLIKDLRDPRKDNKIESDKTQNLLWNLVACQFLRNIRQINDKN